MAQRFLHVPAYCSTIEWTPSPVRVGFLSAGSSRVLLPGYDQPLENLPKVHGHIGGKQRAHTYIFIVSSGLVSLMVAGERDSLARYVI